MVGFNKWEIDVSFKARNVIVSMGGKEINTNVSCGIEYSPKPIHDEREISISLNPDSLDKLLNIDCQYDGTLKRESGEEFRLSGIEFDWYNSISVKSIFIKRIMRTKGKQPRFIQVWREL